MNGDHGRMSLPTDVAETPGRSPMIRCVALDAVGTLIEADPPVVDAYVEIGRRHGSCLDRDQVSRSLSEAFASCDRDDRTGGSDALRTSEELEWTRWRWIVGEVFSGIGSIDSIDRCFDELFEHFGRATSWRCYDDVAATMTRIQELGLEIVIASNFDRRLHAVCSGWPPLQSPRAVVVSSEVGWRKPGRGFFEALVTACGCLAEEVLMVGDDPVNDIQGALACGLQAVRVDRSAGELAECEQTSGLARSQTISSLDGLEAWYR